MIRELQQVMTHRGLVGTLRNEDTFSCGLRAVGSLLGRPSIARSFAIDIEKNEAREGQASSLPRTRDDRKLEVFRHHDRKPSPGQRPGNQGDDSPRGPKARSFTGAVQAVSWQMAGPLALDHLPSPVYPARWAGLGKPAGRWPCIEFECLTENLCTTTRHKCRGYYRCAGEPR